MSPDISVIVPTFRRPKELIEAVQSALSQQGVCVEVIVLDDSPEGGAHDAILSLADTRVIYIKMPSPSGGKPALVRNTGWPHAKGRFVHFLDDDDRVAEGAYAAMRAALDARPDVGVVFGCIAPFGNDPEVLQREQAYFERATIQARRFARLRSKRLLTAYLLFHATLLVNSACMIRRACIAPLGGYDPDCVLNEDTHFYLRAIRRSGYTFVDRAVIHYRTGAPSLMSCRNGDDPLIQAYHHIHYRYRAEYGTLEYLTMKILARTLLR